MSGITIFLLCVIITLTSGEDSKVFTYGDKTASFSCNVSSGLFEGWYFKDKHLTESRYTIQNGSSTSILTINKPTRDDAGVYTVIYTSQNCTYTYRAAPLVLDFPTSKNMEKGNDLNLHCDVRGYPNSTVTWTRDGKVLANDSRITISDDGIVSNAYLYIKSLEYSDEGTYNCTAYSEYFNQSNAKSIIIRVKNPIAWVWPLIGIIVEIIILAVIIFACAKFDKRKLMLAEQNDMHHNESHGIRKHGAEKTE